MSNFPPFLFITLCSHLISPPSSSSSLNPTIHFMPLFSYSRPIVHNLAGYHLSLPHLLSSITVSYPSLLLHPCLQTPHLSSLSFYPNSSLSATSNSSSFKLCVLSVQHSQSLLVQLPFCCLSVCGKVVMSGEVTLISPHKIHLISQE